MALRKELPNKLGKGHTGPAPLTGEAPSSTILVVVAVIVKQGSTVSITEYSLPYMYGTMVPEVTS